MSHYNYFNGTNLGQLARYSNDVTDGYFWFMMTIGLFAILFFSMKNYSTQRAFGAACVITGIIGGMMFSLGVLTDYMALFMLLWTGVGIVALWAEKSTFRSG